MLENNNFENAVIMCKEHTSLKTSLNKKHFYNISLGTTQSLHHANILSSVSI